MILGPVPTSNNNGVGPIQTKEEAEAQQLAQQRSDAYGQSIINAGRELGIEVNDQTRDYLLNYVLSEQGRKNEFADNVFAAQHQYQWLVDDLKKAGLNPFLAMSGLNSAMAQSGSSSVTGGLLTSRQNNQDTNTTNIIKAALTAIASIIGIALFKKA